MQRYFSSRLGELGVNVVLVIRLVVEGSCCFASFELATTASTISDKNKGSKRTYSRSSTRPSHQEEFLELMRINMMREAEARSAEAESRSKLADAVTAIVTSVASVLVDKKKRKSKRRRKKRNLEKDLKMDQESSSDSDSDSSSE